MADDAAALGRQLARRLKGEAGFAGARSLAERMGIAVAYEEAPPPAQPGLRSEYRADPPQIILYRDTLAALAAAVRARGRPEIARCDVVEAHLAHELFHHLERAEGVGPLSREEAEEGAHAFARELLGLDFHPRELSRFAR